MTTVKERLADACRVIRYLRSKCAGIAYLGYGEEAAREGLMITEGWGFLDHMEPDEAAQTLLAMGGSPDA